MNKKINDDQNEVELSLFTRSVYSNIYQEISPHYESVSFRTNGTKFEYFNDRSDTEVAKEFLLNSKYYSDNKEFSYSVAAYFNDNNMMNVYQYSDPWKNRRKFDYSGRKTTNLTNSVKLNISLGDAVYTRRSIRSFTGDKIRLEYLSTLLRCANGITNILSSQLSDGSEVKMELRTCASGGGLYPVEIFFAAVNVNGLEKGIYRYLPNVEMKEELIQFGDNKDLENVIKAFYVPEGELQIEDVGIIMFLVANPWKSMRKYGSRGLRFAFLEAGSITQNIHLGATSLGVGSCDYGGYEDSSIEKILGIDGVQKCLLHTILLGVK